MSYSQLGAIGPKTGHWLYTLAEFKNSYGVGPVIWSLLCECYLGKPWRDVRGTKEGEEALDALAWDLGVPEHHRVVLLFTWPGFYVARTDYLRFASDIRKALADGPAPPEGQENHWPAIADFFETRRARNAAIGLYGASNTSNFFRNKDQATYNLYAYIDAPKETQL